MIDKILVEYLRDNKRIVIPDFGAFLRKDNNGEVVFVEFLRKDDGILQALLSQRASLGASVAATEIEKYVVNLKQEIQEKGGYVIKGIGIMNCDMDGVFHLKYDPSVTQLVQKEDAASLDMSRVDPVPNVPVESTKTGNSDVVVQNLVQTETKMSGMVEKAESTQPSQQKTVDKIEYAPIPVQIDKNESKDYKYGKPGHKSMSQATTSTRQGADKIMIIAIVAALIAIAAMILGVTSKRKVEPLMPVPTVQVQTQQPEQTEGQAKGKSDDKSSSK